jgi:hypothetical protein
MMPPNLNAGTHLIEVRWIDQTKKTQIGRRAIRVE